MVPGEAGRELEVRVEPEAREYLAARGGIVTLRGSRRHGCCGGTAFVPVAEPGAPVDLAGFRTVDVDGVTVHLEEEMTAGPAPLVIGLDRVWRWRRLRVDGTVIRM